MNIFLILNDKNQLKIIIFEAHEFYTILDNTLFNILIKYLMNQNILLKGNIIKKFIF